MKTELTIAESARLIELGIDASIASSSAIYDELGHRSYMAVFTFTDIFSILPKEINYNGLTYGLNMWVDKAVWYLEYVAEVEFNMWDTLTTDNFESPELIDALNRLLIWCLTENKINLKTNNNEK